MNEQIKELAEQAGMTNTVGCFWQSDDSDLERFAELVRQDEREACAKLCDLFSRYAANGPSRYEFMDEGAEECANLIRGRSHERKNQRTS